MASGRAGMGLSGGRRTRGILCDPSWPRQGQPGVDFRVIADRDPGARRHHVPEARFRRDLAAAAIGRTANAQNRDARPDWATFSRFLSLVHVFVQAARACPPAAASSQGCDPNAAERAFDDIANGRNSEANALMLDIFAGVPAAGAREDARDRPHHGGDEPKADGGRDAGPSGENAAIQARKDLASIGLTYHDRNQFFDAVKRERRDRRAAVPLRVGASSPTRRTPGAIPRSSWRAAAATRDHRARFPAAAPK